MFHRVKSEAQDTHTQATKAREADVSKAEQYQKPAGFSSEKQTRSQSQQPAKSKTLNQEKDTQAMNEQSQTTTAPSQANESRAEHAADISGNAYQRSAATASLMAGTNYPGTYPGAYSAAGMAVDSENERKLTIGRGITMSGEIEACDYLLVEGTVEAALKGARYLDVAESGVFYGTVEIGEAVIAGRFEGDITANGRLTIRSTGMVTGSISYSELEVEAGAVIDGSLTPIAARKEVKAAPQASPARATEAPKITAKEVKAQSGENQSEPANTDGGLFSEKVSAAE